MSEPSQQRQQRLRFECLTLAGTTATRGADATTREPQLRCGGSTTLRAMGPMRRRACRGRQHFHRCLTMSPGTYMRLLPPRAAEGPVRYRAWLAFGSVGSCTSVTPGFRPPPRTWRPGMSAAALPTGGRSTFGQLIHTLTSSSACTGMCTHNLEVESVHAYSERTL